jgi:hypothetical protein
MFMLVAVQCEGDAAGAAAQRSTAADSQLRSTNGHGAHSGPGRPATATSVAVPSQSSPSTSPRGPEEDQDPSINGDGGTWMMTGVPPGATDSVTGGPSAQRRAPLAPNDLAAGDIVVTARVPPARAVNHGTNPSAGPGLGTGLGVAIIGGPVAGTAAPVTAVLPSDAAAAPVTAASRPPATANAASQGGALVPGLPAAVEGSMAGAEVAGDAVVVAVAGRALTELTQALQAAGSLDGTLTSSVAHRRLSLLQQAQHLIVQALAIEGEEQEPRADTGGGEY